MKPNSVATSNLNWMALHDESGWVSSAWVRSLNALVLTRSVGDGFQQSLVVYCVQNGMAPPSICGPLPWTCEL